MAYQYNLLPVRFAYSINAHVHTEGIGSLKEEIA